MSGRPKTAGDELRFALAGPAVTAVIAGIFGTLALALPPSAPAALRAVVGYQVEINLPSALTSFPRSRSTAAGSPARCCGAAASTSTRPLPPPLVSDGGSDYFLIAFGVLLTVTGAPGGLWLALIGVFLVVAANAERLQEQVITTLTGVHAEALMSQPAISMPSEATLEQAHQYFARYRHTAFPITAADGRAVGILSIGQLERRPRRARFVDELADRDPALLIGEQDDVAELLEQPAFARVGRAAVLDDQGRPVGIVSLTDIQRAIRADRLRNSNSGPARLAALIDRHAVNCQPGHGPLPLAREIRHGDRSRGRVPAGCRRTALPAVPASMSTGSAAPLPAALAAARTRSSSASASLRRRVVRTNPTPNAPINRGHALRHISGLLSDSLCGESGSCGRNRASGTSLRETARKDGLNNARVTHQTRPGSYGWAASRAPSSSMSTDRGHHSSPEVA
jgi:CBS domain-containing protein